MKGKKFRAIYFDLDTNALEFYYQKDNWNNAYKDIQRFLEKKNFKHEQGSVYHSVIPMEFKCIRREFSVIYIRDESRLTIST